MMDFIGTCRGDESEHSKQTERYTWMNPIVTQAKHSVYLVVVWGTPDYSELTLILS